MDDAQQAALQNYRALLAKVDAKFAEIHGKYEQSMRCARGCYTCCAPHLTVSPIEQAAIRAHFDAHPDALAKARAVERQDPHAGGHCTFLDEKGHCSIYEARPIVCRSHGVPLKVKIEIPRKKETVSVCPFNLEDEDILNLPASDYISLDTLNTILALINRQWDADGKLPRVPLTIAGILG